MGSKERQVNAARIKLNTRISRAKDKLKMTKEYLEASPSLREHLAGQVRLREEDKA
jgi:hypothetical protein